MSATVPITNGDMTAGAQVFMGLGSAAETPPAQAAHEVQGTGNLAGLHNTPMHVAGILLFAGLIIAGLHLGGWRMAFDVGMGRG